MRIMFGLLAFFVVAGLGNAQSLWNPDRPARPVFSDTTARGIGDILTIVIDETQQVQNNEQSQFDKDSSINAVLSNFDVIPALFDTLPQVTGSANREFSGQARVDKNNRFRTRIAVVVVDVMPNGNLLVEGTRRITTDGDAKIIRVSGMVRPYDVSKQNTISSESVANASFSIQGQGPSAHTVQKGWFSRFLDVVWPF